MQNLWGSRFEPMDSPNRTCWTSTSRSSPRFSNLFEPNHKSGSRFRQIALWTGPNRTAASLPVSTKNHRNINTFTHRLASQPVDCPLRYTYIDGLHFWARGEQVFLEIQPCGSLPTRNHGNTNTFMHDTKNGYHSPVPFHRHICEHGPQVWVSIWWDTMTRLLLIWYHRTPIPSRTV